MEPEQPVVEAEDQPLTEAELAASPLMEAGGGEVIVPAKGKLFAEDGSMKVAIIRPCISRGKRIKGLPPIYEAQMLARCASIFRDWPMYMDHLYEAAELIEALKKFHRPITDLGGRVLESWFDPEFKASHDDEKGYRPGAIVGRSIPQPAIRAMLEADPGILNVSINCFPTGARPGTASWNPGLRGMLIEGLSPVPRGSVDWVFRGGAGGHPIAEEDVAFAVSVVEELYAARRHEEHEVSEVDWSKLSLSELREQLEQKNPALLEALAPPKVPETSTGGVTPERLQEMLDAQKAEFTTTLEEKLAERDDEVETEVDARLREREEARRFERQAHALIESSTLPKSWKDDLRNAYSVLPSGPTRNLLVEAEDDKTVEEVLAERVNADVEHALDRLAEATGAPRVRALGGGSGAGDGEPAATPLSEGQEYLESSLLEAGVLKSGEDGKSNIDSLLESLEA